ncbi:MAG TPA: nucleotidyltransferase domain-containing protein [Nitrososphaeraceae archaeon]|nr:nucleotidyltransferase domain-containing protein [Nitrososphaeraceae archaeon]
MSTTTALSSEQLGIIKRAVSKIAKKYKVAGFCLYGSRVAGYSRPDSDFDVIIVLEDYPYALKYIYTVEENMKISALVVDLARFRKDAESSFLGEFVIGRLLHIYEPLQNKQLFQQLEVAYKKRVILDEIYNIVKSANILSTEIIFPLEYIMFSKVRYRSLLYPNAAYSYYQIYTGQNSQYNIKFALDGYQKALEGILSDDNELLDTERSGKYFQISERRIDVQKNQKIASLKLTKKLQEFSSYFIHAYAGRHTLRHVIKEAESKISRHKANRVTLPKFISNPKDFYWELPEGDIIIDDKNWLDTLAKCNGFSKYKVTQKRVLGTRNDSTVLFVIEDSDDHNLSKSVVVKDMALNKRAKWGNLGRIPSSMHRSKVDPLFRLGNEYKALRHIRSIGLHSPMIQSVVLDKTILVCEFIEGELLSNVLKRFSSNKYNADYDLDWINLAGQHFARIHTHSCTLGDIKPSNLIISNNTLYFTGLDQFNFNSDEPFSDIIYFISNTLDEISTNTYGAKQILEEFFEGYSKQMPAESIKKFFASEYYPKVLYNKFSATIAETIKEQIAKSSK